MIYALKKIPQELRRFAVLAAVASIIITAIIHSRDEHVSPGEMGSKKAFQRPSNREQAEGWFIPTLWRPTTKWQKLRTLFHCRDHASSHQVSIMNWCERKAMQKKASTCLSNDRVFQKLRCLNPVIYPNETDVISRSAVTDAELWIRAARIARKPSPQR